VSCGSSCSRARHPECRREGESESKPPVARGILPCLARISPKRKWAPTWFGFNRSAFPGGHRLCAFAGAQFYPFPWWLARPLARVFSTAAFSILLILRKDTGETGNQFLDGQGSVGILVPTASGGKVQRRTSLVGFRTCKSFHTKSFHITQNPFTH